MKHFKLLFPCIFLALAFVACSGTKEARKTEQKLDGSWQLQTIETEGIAGAVKVKIFNEANIQCFTGSAWKFNPGNNLGSYTISKNADDCFSIKREFRWSMYQEKDAPLYLQFKRLNENLKEIDGDDAGYRLRVIQINDSNLQLKMDIQFEGRPAALLFNFVAG